MCRHARCCQAAVAAFAFLVGAWLSTELGWYPALFPNGGKLTDHWTRPGHEAPTLVATLAADWKSAPLHNEPLTALYAVGPSDITAALISRFQVSGRCRGGLRQVGTGIAICSDVLESTRHLLFFGVKAWTEFGRALAESGLHWPDSSVVVDCSAQSQADATCPPGRTGCGVTFKKACFYEQQENPFPPDIQRLTPKSDSVVGIFNAEALEWKLLHAAQVEDFRPYRMVVIRFFWLEQQVKHFLYLQVMELLLQHFHLVSVSASPCHGRWHVAGSSLLVPRVVWATLVRKDLASEAVAQTDIRMSRDSRVC